MPKRRFLLVSLLACVLLGCNRTPPAPPPVAPPPEVDKKETGAPDPGKHLTSDQLLEQRVIWFLIHAVRDNNHENELRSKIVGLKDAEPKNIISGGGGFYGAGDRCIRVSPISDFEAAAAKVDFGLVLAVDPVDRVILVDASAKPAPRPANGWPGTKAIAEYIVRTIAARWEPGADSNLVKKFGRDKVVAVLTPGPAKDLIIKKLETLAPVATHHGPRFYGAQASLLDVTRNGVYFEGPYFVLCVVAPVAKVSDVVKALDGVANVVVDEERRVVIVDFPALKPRWPAVWSQKPAPPK